MELSHSPSFLINLETEEAELGNELKNAIPRQFWTKYTATGEMNGYGTEDGYDKIVLKSYIDRFWGVRNGRLYAASERAGSWEKFTPIIAGKNLVSFKTWENKYVSCNDGQLLYD